jgi:hypothetical protein
MLPPGTCRLGSWPVSDTTCVDDFFMATPVVVCGGSTPSFTPRIAARAIFSCPILPCLVPPCVDGRCRGRADGGMARPRVDPRCHARASGHPVPRDGAVAAVAVPLNEEESAGEGGVRDGHPAPGRTRAMDPKTCAQMALALRWTARDRFATRPRLRGIARGRHSGRIAQLVEQLTLNQRVLGSSPSAPTKKPLRSSDLQIA